MKKGKKERKQRRTKVGKKERKKNFIIPDKKIFKNIRFEINK